MTKYLSCEVCEGKKQPLFKIYAPDGTKHYVCKACIAKVEEKYKKPPK